MSEPVIQILMIDDDEDDALLVKRLLGGSRRVRYQVAWAASYEDGLARICSNSHDICLLDYNLGAHNGLELLCEARRCQCMTPVIMLTGLGAEDVDQAAMEAGALDYLSKSELTGNHLERSIRYGLQQAKTLRALRQAQEELERKVEQRTAELSAANERLAETDRRKDMFLAMLAHELRNPLAPIRNAVHLLNAHCDASCAKNAVTQRQREIIERQVRHMARLLEDLLDVSRITRGKIELRREPLDLRTVAGLAIESMRSQIEARRQQFTFQSSAAPLRVEGDPTRLEQVLRNLLHNATKYTEPGGSIWMTLGAEAADGGAGWAVTRVRDSGIGMDPELLQQVFEPFVQAEQGLARSQGGLGIGLSMVKTLVELHGGTVEAHSEGPETGSEFIIRLPLMASVVEKGATGRMAEADAASTAQSTSRRILVVDDNADAAASLGELLGLWGHQIRTAGDGRQALAAARQWQPEVILLDIGLPGMDGYEVARRLREEPATAGSYLVALTGYGAEEDRQRALEAGFDRHLTKPVALETLQALLQRAA